MYADPSGSRQGTRWVPGGSPEGPRSLHFRGKRPIPRLPTLASSCARPLSAAAQHRDLVRECVVQVVELELIRARRAAEDDAADGVPEGTHAVNAVREHLVPEQRVIDVREARPAKSPSQAAKEVHHKNQGPTVAVHEDFTQAPDVEPKAARVADVNQATLS